MTGINADLLARYMMRMAATIEQLIEERDAALAELEKLKPKKAEPEIKNNK